MTRCDECGQEIDAVDLALAHHPHVEGCGFSTAGWCRCSAVTHASCCPECHPDSDHGEREEHAA